MCIDIEKIIENPDAEARRFQLGSVCNTCNRLEVDKTWKEEVETAAVGRGSRGTRLNQSRGSSGLLT
jgi:hypothetical protein